MANKRVSKKHWQKTETTGRLYDALNRRVKKIEAILKRVAGRRRTRR